MFLTACGNPTAPSSLAGFSLLASGGVNVPQGASNDVTLSIKRSNNFSEAIDLGLDGLPADVTASFSENPVTGDSTILTLSASETMAMGTYSFTVKGLANGLEKTATVSLEVTSAATQVDSMSIKDNGSSTQVRQGKSFTLQLTGKRLLDISKATLGDKDASIGSSQPDNNSFLNIHFNNIQHGEKLGTRNLTLTTSTGEIVVEDAVSGVRLSNDGLVDASLLGIELKVIITHECSGQTCWGFITLEDKTIPELLCSNDTIPCTTSADPSVLGFPVDAASTVTAVAHQQQH